MGRAADIGRGDRRAVERGARHGHRQGRIERRDPLDGGHLHLDHAAVLDGVRDLQHPGAAIVIGQSEVLVALADDVGGDDLEAEVRARDLRRLVGAQCRRDGVEHVGRHRCRSYSDRLTLSRSRVDPRGSAGR